MTAIAKSSNTRPAAKKCCGWEEPAIWTLIIYMQTEDDRETHVSPKTKARFFFLNEPDFR